MKNKLFQKNRTWWFKKCVEFAVKVGLLDKRWPCTQILVIFEFKIHQNVAPDGFSDKFIQNSLFLFTHNSFEIQSKPNFRKIVFLKYLIRKYRCLLVKKALFRILKKLTNEKRLLITIDSHSDFPRYQLLYLLKSYPAQPPCRYF